MGPVRLMPLKPPLAPPAVALPPALPPQGPPGEMEAEAGLRPNFCMYEVRDKCCCFWKEGEGEATAAAAVDTDAVVTVLVAGPASAREAITPTLLISTRGSGEICGVASVSSLGVFAFDIRSRRWQLSRTAFSKSSESRLIYQDKNKSPVLSAVP